MSDTYCGTDGVITEEIIRDKLKLLTDEEITALWVYLCCTSSSKELEATTHE